jgi:pimeloyl-ACP methyl ester carboxylesterase
MRAESGSTQAAKNVVLVHGAFADGSSWSKVITLLQAKGLRVTSVGNPFTSFADDVAATKRAIAAQDGPTVLVGHSYGGVVIAEAGNDPKVVSLVYVAAFAPDAGQSIVDISKGFPKPAGLDQLQPQPDGFVLLSPKGIEEDFAQDLTAPEKALLVAVQPQTIGRYSRRSLPPLGGGTDRRGTSCPATIELLPQSSKRPWPSNSRRRLFSPPAMSRSCPTQEKLRR